MLNSERQPENDFASFYQAKTSAAHLCQTQPIKRKHRHAPCFHHIHFQAAFFRSQRQPCPFVQIFDLGIKGYA